jgi:hypothetical protein
LAASRLGGRRSRGRCQAASNNAAARPSPRPAWALPVCAPGLVHPSDWNAAQRGCLSLYPTARLADGAEKSSSRCAQPPGCPRDKSCRAVTFFRLNPCDKTVAVWHRRAFSIVAAQHDMVVFELSCSPRLNMAAISDLLFEHTPRWVCGDPHHLTGCCGCPSALAYSPRHARQARARRPLALRAALDGGAHRPPPVTYSCVSATIAE